MIHYRVHGFTLIEVLIAWALLSSVLFSVITLNIRNSRYLYHLYLQNIAITQLQNMLERLRANRRVVWREREVALWNTQNQRVLPNGAGSYYCTAQICTVCICWLEKTTQQLTLSSLL